MSNGNKPPKTLAEWIRYLHMARAVPQGSPDYADAQEAVRFALQRIRTLNAVASQKDQVEAAQVPAITPQGAIGAGLMHGLSLGAGEPIAGLLAALVPGGENFAGGAQRYRLGLENIGLQHPTLTPTGEVAGMALQSALPISRAVQGGTAVGAAIPSMRANLLARFFTGAGQTDILPALTLGAVQGFSAGGADPGDLRARATRAATTGATAAVGAAALGGLGALRVPRWLNSVKREIRRAAPKGTASEVIDGMTEANIRQELTKQGFDAATQNRILETWRAGKTIVPPPPPAPTLRPGETITPISPKGLAVEGPAPPIPQGPFPPSLPEMQGFSSTSRATPKPISVGTIPPGSSLEEVQASKAFNSRLRGPLNARRMALEELFQASAEGESGLPQSLVSALKQMDNLGFDTPENAIAAILQHADWRTRWDVMQPANKVAVQTIANWKAQVLGYGGRAAKALPDIGQGQTLPYYPRGGGVEQAFGAPPVSTAAQSVNPNQLQPYIDFLRANGPQGFPAQAQALRSLGVPLPPTADAELARLLFGGS